MNRFILFISLFLFCIISSLQAQNSYADLEDLYDRWRTFETPPTLNVAPDYTAETFDARQPMFEKLQAELESMKTDDWTVEQQVD